MPNTPERDLKQKQRPSAPPRKEDTETSEEVVREQAKTETEERPYLDTEGGE